MNFQRTGKALGGISGVLYEITCHGRREGLA